MKNVIIFLNVFLLSTLSFAEKSDSLAYGTFSFSHDLTLPGQPEVIYDAATGDISGWWDHTFSGNPAKLYMEAKPNGGFYEIFDESGDGVLHATVIAAQRGKMLRFVGPLGLAGYAVDLVCTYTFTFVHGDSTHLKLDVNAAGQFHPGWPDVVKKVWLHFLDDQFKPYIENGKHLKTQ